MTIPTAAPQPAQLAAASVAKLFLTVGKEPATAATRPTPTTQLKASILATAVDKMRPPKHSGSQRVVTMTTQTAATILTTLSQRATIKDTLTAA